MKARISQLSVPHESETGGGEEGVGGDDEITPPSLERLIKIASGDYPGDGTPISAVPNGLWFHDEVENAQGRVKELEKQVMDLKGAEGRVKELEVEVSEVRGKLLEAVSSRGNGSAQDAGERERVAALREGAKKEGKAVVDSLRGMQRELGGWMGEWKAKAEGDIQKVREEGEKAALKLSRRELAVGRREEALWERERGQKEREGKVEERERGIEEREGVMVRREGGA